MSFFKKVFGKDRILPSESVQSAQTIEAINKLREVVDMLNKKYNYLNKLATNELAEAKKCGTKNKSQAIIHLKRKAKYLKQQQDATNMIDNIEAQIDALQSLATTRQMVNAMDVAKQEFKAAKQDIDKLDDMMQDIEENMADIQEVTQIISRPIQSTQQFDEDELLQELEEYEQEEINEKMAQISTLPEGDTGSDLCEIPNIPDKIEDQNIIIKKVPKKIITEDLKDDMDDLLAWAN